MRNLVLSDGRSILAVGRWGVEGGVAIPFSIFSVQFSMGSEKLDGGIDGPVAYWQKHSFCARKALHADTRCRRSKGRRQPNFIWRGLPRPLRPGGGGAAGWRGVRSLEGATEYREQSSWNIDQYAARAIKGKG